MHLGTVSRGGGRESLLAAGSCGAAPRAESPGARPKRLTSDFRRGGGRDTFARGHIPRRERRGPYDDPDAQRALDLIAVLNGGLPVEENGIHGDVRALAALDLVDLGVVQWIGDADPAAGRAGGLRGLGGGGGSGRLAGIEEVGHLPRRGDADGERTRRG